MRLNHLFLCLALANVSCSSTDAPKSPLNDAYSKNAFTLWLGGDDQVQRKAQIADF